MPKKIAVLGGSFNPPAKHHRRIAEELLELFDEVVVVPCGPRPDKATTNDIDPIHRAAMVDMTFGGLERLRVDLFDLEQAAFTRTKELEEKYRPEGEVWHLVGSDLAQGGGRGESFIQRGWHDGPDLWNRLNFVVHERAGYPLGPGDLPPRHRLITPECSGSSTEVRERCFKRQPIDVLVTPDVAAYIDRHGLYRGGRAANPSRLCLERPRVLLEIAANNVAAEKLAERFAPFVDAKDPNVIVVVGGDGMMLHMIRKHWRRRLPFCGVNAGHLGFLLNDAAESEDPLKLLSDLRLYHSPLLYVEMMLERGETFRDLAFNDAYVKHVDQTAWVEVKVNGAVKLKKLACDAALVGTAAGSTAYARSMGATPLLIDRPGLVLAATAVCEPFGWRPAHLPADSRIEFQALDPVKRPMVGYVDGVSYGPVFEMKIRTSRIAAAELAFSPNGDLAEKRIAIQFPSQ